MPTITLPAVVAAHGGIAVDDPAAQAYERSMRASNRSAKTVALRRMVLGLLAAYLDKPLLDATLEDLRGWSEHLETDLTAAGNPRAESGRHTYVSVCRSFYKWAVEEEMILRDPSRRLEVPRPPEERPHKITPEDLHFALESATDQRLRVWMLLACGCGMRCMEIAAMERSDVDTSDGEPSLLIHGKGRRDRVVPLHRDVLAELRPFLTHPGRIFLRVDGSGPVTASIVSKTINKHLAGLGLDARAHWLRHYYATWTWRIGRDPKLVQQLMGHRSLSSTGVYVEPDWKQVGPVLDKLIDKIGL